MQLWILFIFVVLGVFLVFLALALHERLKERAPSMAKAATAFGLIWAGLLLASGMVFKTGLDTALELFRQDPAQAVTVWLVVNALQEGVGGAYELPGGL